MPIAWTLRHVVKQAKGILTYGDILIDIYNLIKC